MRIWVCYLEIIVQYAVALHCTECWLRRFVWCHVCFPALEINESVCLAKLQLKRSLRSLFDGRIARETMAEGFS